ncbi:Carbon-nitrogen hydrolase [Boothiomyces macroporosus]|uniref:Carbon-nitrogen hydrolase n=1 Tax=Boothiomyces macroporosus TaxID=261099 RepID=A0AAD5YB27_9FUNG|nr:Carbon-nitrogen hydrolase [Boothiomyces macroporosus]
MVKLALVQLLVSSNKQQNLKRAATLIKEAANKGANIVVLPECFNSPYGIQYFEEYAEELHGETARALSAMAKESNVYLIGGSFPEIQFGKYYNTCTIWNRVGELIGTHRKVHLFDIDIPGKITFQESKVLSPGNELTLVDTEHGTIGVGICYDIRFPEMAMIAARKGAFAMIYPGAFNTTTGPLHWELLQRARAVDNQMFVAACSPARDTSATYHAWGHSTVVDPMGKVLATTEESEAIVEAELDIEEMKNARTSIPVSFQRRFDLYKNVAE